MDTIGFNDCCVLEEKNLFRLRNCKDLHQYSRQNAISFVFLDLLVLAEQLLRDLLTTIFASKARHVLNFVEVVQFVRNYLMKTSICTEIYKVPFCTLGQEVAPAWASECGNSFAMGWYSLSSGVSYQIGATYGPIRAMTWKSEHTYGKYGIHVTCLSHPSK